MAVKEYKKTEQKQLSKNFRLSEFRCKCHNPDCTVTKLDDALVEWLQKIRDHYGKAVNINSAYRTPTYNKKVGGATYSQHLYGTAADIRINGVKPKDLAAYIETLMPNYGGIGIYPTFVHVDIRKVKSRWNG